jgi:N-acetylmuramoyl-L-alanine amidase
MYTQSYYLAQYVLNAIVNIVGTRDNGVRVNPSLYVLKRTNMPAILVELAYLTNEADAKKLETKQPEFARAIYEGLLGYFDLDQ